MNDKKPVERINHRFRYKPKSRDTEIDGGISLKFSHPVYQPLPTIDITSNGESVSPCEQPVEHPFYRFSNEGKKWVKIPDKQVDKPKKYAPFGSEIPIEEFARLKVLMGEKRWEQVNPKRGQIHALPSTVGSLMVAICEDGRCLLEKADGKAMLAHKDWFVEEAATSLDDACEEHEKRQKQKQRVRKLPEDLIVLGC